MADIVLNNDVRWLSALFNVQLLFGIFFKYFRSRRYDRDKVRETKWARDEGKK
jgi:hypothetical protein